MALRVAERTHERSRNRDSDLHLPPRSPYERLMPRDIPTLRRNETRMGSWRYGRIPHHPKPQCIIEGTPGPGIDVSGRGG
jgi:hypothetical protein